MNAMRNLSAVLLSSSLALTALPAGANHTFNGFNASRSNTAGDTTKILEPHATHFCYLSAMGVEDTDTGGETAVCRVLQDASVWILQARLFRNDDADVVCSAACVRY